jgi:hypothetical protein
MTDNQCILCAEDALWTVHRESGSVVAVECCGEHLSLTCLHLIKEDKASALVTALA